MKKLIRICLLGMLAMAFATRLTWGQTFDENNRLVKKIEVYGNAEREVTPDEIYFTITLKEYLEDSKNKISIDGLERELYNAVRKVGVRDEDFQIMDVASYNYDWYWRDKKREREEFLASKQYRITFKDLNEINRLFAYVDPKGIQSTNIAGYSHSDIEKIRRELKIEALKNAKDKAEYLLDGIKETLGEVIEVQEINNDYQPPIYYAKTMEMREAADAMEQPEIDFKTIKLQSQVRTVFRIR